MKKSSVLVALSLLLFAASFAVVFGQKRPAVKPKSTAAKPETVEKTTEEPAVAPVPAPTPAPVSPAQAFFSEGLKCAKEDYDCQISNYTKAVNLNLNTKEAFKNRGNAYLQRKDFDKAIADFTKLIELDLNDASGYKNRGRIYLENSNSPQAVNAAIRDFTSAIDLEPKDVEAYKLRSSVYMKLRDYDKAKADMDKIVAIDPNNFDVIIIQGEMFLADKQYEKAVEILTKAIGIKPTSKLYLGRANAYAAQKKYDLAISDFSKVIEFDPKNADAYNARGNAYLQSDKTDLAIQDINKAVAIDPTKAGSLIDLAKSFEKQTKYDDAIKIYDTVLASAPKDDVSQYLYNRGWLNLLKQDANSAIADATKSLEINPKNAKAFELRCMAFTQLKDYQSAMDDCSDAIDLDSTIDYAYTYRGLAAYTITGKLEGQAQTDMDKGYSNSIANADKALAQKSDDFDALVKRAGGNMGLKSYAAAIQDYKRLINLNPKYEEAYNGLAASNSLMNGFTEATLATNANFQIQTLTQGISANPESVTLYNSRGMTYQFKDDRSAVNDFNKAILNYTKKTKPTETEKIYTQLAISSGASAYHRLKDNTSALVTINKCDELFPDNLSCLTYKGSFYLSNLKDYQKAVEAYNKAINLFSLKKSSEIGFNAPSVFYNLAEAYFGLNDKSNALAAINKGLSLFPNDKHMWDYAAMFYKYKIKDIGKATDHYNKAAQLGSELAKQSLGYIAEEKQRKKQRRNAAILSILGAVNQGLETYNNSRQNSRQQPTTSQIPQPNTSSRPQTTGSGSPSSSGQTRTSSAASCSPEALKGIIFGGDGVDCNQYLMPGATVGVHSVTSGTWENCSQPDESGFKYCWGAWQQSGLSQISFRLLGPGKEKTARDNPYLWTVGFKNTSNAIVKFSPEIVFGDGTTHPGSDYAMSPGDEIVWHVTKGTSSSSSTASIRIRRYAICTNVSSTTINGERGYKCN